MKAIILAAGYGGRMRPFTDNRHKTMLSVAGETIIENIINSLEECGITDIIIGTGYRHEELVKFLRERYPKHNFQFVHNERYASTNNIYTLALIFEKVNIDDDIILIESDLIFKPVILKQLIESPYENVALVDKFRTGMDGTVVKLAGNVVASVIPPHLQDSNFDFSDKYKTLNIYKFSRNFIEKTFKKLLSFYARTIDDNCYYELILGMLIYMQQKKIYAEIIEGNDWAEVDDPNDLKIAEYVFNPEKRFQILEESWGGFWNYDFIDFCFIRNMYFPNASIISEMKENIEKLLHSYGSKQSILNRKLSYFLLCSENNVQLLNGAAQIYPILRNLVGDMHALVPSPTFGEYERIFKKISRYDDKVGISKVDLEQKLQDVEIIVIVNPNNPTGSLMPTMWIYEQARDNPNKLFIVDESFIEFASQPSILELLEQNPLDNVLVIKSLSKSLGLPGLRLGYVFTCNQDLMRQIRAETPIWNSNSIAEFYIELLLKHRASLAESISRTIRDREEFQHALKSCDKVDEVFPSQANFILVKLKGDRRDAASLARSMLMEANIYVKDVSSKFNDGQGYFRIAVRLPEENRLFVKMLERQT